ncbi:MAG: NAD-dependent epimerase/dehydratase family protein [Pseudomonadota bacterium]
MGQRYTLVTGGAGYIGSHVVRQLGKKGEPCHSPSSPNPARMAVRSPVSP